MAEHAYPARTLSRAAVTGAPERRWMTSPLSALALAGACVVILAAIWLIAAFVPAVHFRDAQALYDFTRLSRPRVDSVASFLLHLLEPALFILWAIALIAVAVARERPRAGLAIAAVMGLAPLTAEQLKPLLAHSHDQVGYVTVGSASWPSGHATAAAALAISAVIVAPAVLRLLVATLGGMFVLAVGVSLLILHWHMPSDVLGGYFVAALWGSLAVAALRAGERRWPRRVRSRAPGRDGQPRPS